MEYAKFGTPLFFTEINECDSNPCINNGSCTDLIADFRCTCIAGFTGKQCQVNIDECASFPCLNNATCKDQINDFACDCISGFTVSTSVSLIRAQTILLAKILSTHSSATVNQATLGKRVI